MNESDERRKLQEHLTKILILRNDSYTQLRCCAINWRPSLLGAIGRYERNKGLEASLSSKNAPSSVLVPSSDARSP